MFCCLWITLWITREDHERNVEDVEVVKCKLRTGERWKHLTDLILKGLFNARDHEASKHARSPRIKSAYFTTLILIAGIFMRLVISLAGKAGSPKPRSAVGMITIWWWGVWTALQEKHAGLSSPRKIVALEISGQAAPFLKSTRSKMRWLVECCKVLMFPAKSE